MTRYECAYPEQLIVEKLPDGSTCIFDHATKSVHSLNASATIVWETCHKPSTADGILAAMERHFGHGVDPDVVQLAIERLHRAGLICGEAPARSEPPIARRQALESIVAISGIVLPVVLTMSASEQRVYAQGTGTSPTTPATAPTTIAPTTTSATTPTTVPPTTTAPTTVPPTSTSVVVGPSDRRLKRDVAAVGRLDNGLALYSFRYLDSDGVYVGVMAQEVLQVAPEAVSVGGDGFMRVHYDRIGFQLMTWKDWALSHQ